MDGFILLLLIYSQQGGMTSTSTIFETEAACRQAGNVAIGTIPWDGGPIQVRFVCVPRNKDTQ